MTEDLISVPLLSLEIIRQPVSGAGKMARPRTAKSSAAAVGVAEPPSLDASDRETPVVTRHELWAPGAPTGGALEDAPQAIADEANNPRATIRRLFISA